MTVRQDIEIATLPVEVEQAINTLTSGGFEAYLVGGCVRDLLIGRKPKDWDITTNAKPEQIIALFPKTFYENSFGTVGVVNEQTTDETLKIIEVTPYRTESVYSDGRRPDAVEFSSRLEDDLKRRDFTINAIALCIAGKSGSGHKGQVIDLYNGIQDMAKGVIRTVGNPDERFAEDGLRILRAVRLSSELGFTINIDTQKAISGGAGILSKISKERIRDEFSKIVMSQKPMDAIILLNKLSLLSYIVPEMVESVGIEQNQAHSFDVWEHLLRSLDHSAKKGLSLEVRLAVMLHDIGKPTTRRKGGNGEWTFYGHEVVGARMANAILARLRFPVKTIDKVVKLVRWHMFFSDTEQITLSAVRRIIAKVGRENIWDLMDLRGCDRVGTGRPKENPYRLRKYKSMIEEALRDPISVGMLAIDGSRIMEVTKIAPGPKIGHILHALLEEVLDDPTKNKKEYLEDRSMQLAVLSEQELKELGGKGRERKDEQEERALGDIRKKYWVE
jgi:putative nucleotidyltransferase with HDIG domain